jgi:NAD(P)H-dependent flavin oxidoreductase YrpB (nitropropane dioxygenase family)
METSFTRLVGCVHPLQQAAMGGVATPELAGAVALAGGLGMLGEFEPEPAPTRTGRALSLAGDGAIGMGFFGQWMQHDLANYEAAAAQLRVVEIFWSAPDASIVERARRSGNALVAWQVGSVDDAVGAEDAGCDLVVVQGVEAGGHVRGTTARDELLDATLPRVSIPVVAAGGIATPRDVARLIARGAAAVRVGTAFVACEESNAHPEYVDALIKATSGDDTVLTTAFDQGWPDAPHRVLRSALLAAQADPDASFSPLPPGRDATGPIDAMALYAGMGVGAVDQLLPAAALVGHLMSALDSD